MTEASPPLLRTEKLCRVYQDGKVQAVRDVSCEIQRGDYIALMGPSGCGKSTLLNLLGSLDRPTSGEIHFAGQPLSKHPDIDAFRARSIGFVFQSFHLIPVLSAVRNIQVPMFEAPGSSRSREVKAMQLLERVHMTHRALHKPNALSGGERQRVAIARALANDPRLLLADEPTGNLDSKTAVEIMDLFDQLHRSGLTIVLVTHDTALAERARRIIRMRDGQLE